MSNIPESTLAQEIDKVNRQSAYLVRFKKSAEYIIEFEPPENVTFKGGA